MANVNYYTFHIWGLNNKPSLISPDSIALEWFINDKLKDNNNKYEIVISNNTDISPNNELPLLIVNNNERKIIGYNNIIKYLLDNHNDLIEDSILNFIKNKFELITKYQLFLNEQNYNNFTKIEFSKMLYWPMWYNTPQSYKNDIKRQIEDTFVSTISLNYDNQLDDNTDQQEVDNEFEPSELAQSKTFKLNKEAKIKNKNKLKEINSNFQICNQLKILLKEYLKIEKLLPITSNLRNFEYSFLANIYILINLPNSERIIDTIKEQLGMNRWSAINRIIHELNCKHDDTKFREPEFKEQGNIWMSIRERVLL